MSSLLKIIIGIVAAILVVVVLAVGAFALFFDANDFRGRITAEVKKATGRELVIGDIHLSIFPTLGATIKNATLSNAPGFGDTPFAVIGEADVGVQLLPLLLHRAVKVGKVSLNGLQVNAVKNADGSSNWDDLAKGGGDKPAVEKPAPDSGGSGIKSIDIGGVSISDAAINYTDNQAKTAYSLKKLNLKIGSIRPGKPFDFALDFATSVAKPAVNASVSVAATLALDIEKQLFKAEKLRATVDAEGESLPGGRQKVEFTGDALYDGSKGTAKLAGGDLQVAGLNATLALDGSGLNGDTPHFSGPLSIKPFSPRELLAALGTKIQTADPAALKDMSIKARIDATSKSARLDDLVIKLDQSMLSGTAGISNLSTQAAQFALTLDAIDADRYLPPKSPAQAPAAAPATPAEKAKADAAPLPVDALDKINASGTIDIAKLKLSGINMTKVRLKLDAAKGHDKRIDLSSNLYGGSLSATTRITPGGRTAYAESLHLSSISAGPLLKDFTGKESMTGQGNVTLEVTSAGKTMGEIKRALNGDVGFSFTNGAVKGFNLGQILRRGQALLSGQQLAASEPQQTDFTELSAKGKISNGVLVSDALDAKSPLFRLDGAGKINLVDETLDYTAKPTVVNTATGQGGKELTDLAGIVIPIHITGPWSAPKYSLDLKTALQQKATEKLRGKLSDQIDKQLGDKLGDSPLKDTLKQGLGSFFGNKKKPAQPAPPPSP